MVPLGSIARKLEKLVVDNSPVILTAVGVTGTVMTAYLTGRASVKAVEVIRTQQEFLDEVGGITTPMMEPKEKVRLVWKLYLPAASTMAVTIAAIVCANRVGTRRAAALAAAYTVTERAFEEYKTKVVERLGDKKEQGIRDEIAQDRVNKNPSNDKTVIVTGNGSVLCYEAFTGRYFLCDMETLRKAVNDINHQVIHDSFASLSDFYDLIGLEATSQSDELGWNMDHLLEIHYSTTLSDSSTPCISIDYALTPIRRFTHFK
jgi:hypothetical protein